MQESYIGLYIRVLSKYNIPFNPVEDLTFEGYYNEIVTYKKTIQDQE